MSQNFCSGKQIVPCGRRRTSEDLEIRLIESPQVTSPMYPKDIISTKDMYSPKNPNLTSEQLVWQVSQTKDSRQQNYSQLQNFAPSRIKVYNGETKGFIMTHYSSATGESLRENKNLHNSNDTPDFKQISQLSKKNISAAGESTRQIQEEESFNSSQVDISFSSIQSSFHIDQAVTMLNDTQQKMIITSLHSTPAYKSPVELSRPKQISCELTPQPSSPAPKAMKRQAKHQTSKGDLRRKDGFITMESIFEGSFAKTSQKPIIIFNDVTHKRKRSPRKSSSNKRKETSLKNNKKNSRKQSKRNNEDVFLQRSHSQSLSNYVQMSPGDNPLPTSVPMSPQGYQPKGYSALVYKVTQDIVQNAAKDKQSRAQQMKHIYEMRLRERQLKLKLEMMREDSKKREMMDAGSSTKKLNKNQEKFLVERQLQDIQFRKIKQQEMENEKYMQETREIDQMFKPQILDKSKQMYMKRQQDRMTQSVYASSVFERLNQKAPSHNKMASEMGSQNPTRSNSKLQRSGSDSAIFLVSAVSDKTKERIKLRQESALRQSLARREHSNYRKRVQKGEIRDIKLNSLYLSLKGTPRGSIGTSSQNHPSVNNENDKYKFLLNTSVQEFNDQPKPTRNDQQRSSVPQYQSRTQKKLDLAHLTNKYKPQLQSPKHVYQTESKRPENNTERPNYTSYGPTSGANGPTSACNGPNAKRPNSTRFSLQSARGQSIFQVGPLQPVLSSRSIIQPVLSNRSSKQLKIR